MLDRQKIQHFLKLRKEGVSLWQIQSVTHCYLETIRVLNADCESDLLSLETAKWIATGQWYEVELVLDITLKFSGSVSCTTFIRRRKKLVLPIDIS